MTFLGFISAENIRSEANPPMVALFWKGYLYHWYCAEHCNINGFCWYCGEFWGGCEAFDFEPTGCCPNCKDEFKSDLGEIAKPMKGRNSRNLRKMNINRPFSLLLSSFLYGYGRGFSRPRPLLEYAEEYVYD
jgi:hypothetical protein